MPHPSPTVKTFRVAYRVPGAATALAAGIVTIDIDHHIEVIAAKPEFADLLALAAETLNASEVFMLRAASKPGNPPLTLRRQNVPRTAPEAAEALAELLSRTYGLELIAARPDAPDSHTHAEPPVKLE